MELHYKLVEGYAETKAQMEAMMMIRDSSLALTDDDNGSLTPTGSASDVSIAEKKEQGAVAR